MENELIKDKIYKELLEEISIGKYDKDFVFHEKKLMAYFNVSRAPIREALVRLCSEQILESFPKKGYMIKPLSLKQLSEIAEYRVMLECGFFNKNTFVFNQCNEKKLKQFIENIENNPKRNLTALEHWDNNISFHLLLFSFYNNEYAYNELKNALNIQTRFYIQNKWNRWHSKQFNDFAQTHKFILNAIFNKQYDEALIFLKQDIEDISFSYD